MPAAVRLGVHVSIAGGIERAVFRAAELGCSAMQIFSRNPRGWMTSPLSPQAVLLFRRAAVAKDIRPVVVHTPYLLNLASQERVLFEQSLSALILDLKRAEQLGAGFVVTHLGSGAQGGRASAVGRVVQGLRAALRVDSPVRLLLENSAGGGGSLGATLEELKEIIAGAGGDPRLGVCFDSCHGYAAGYDFTAPEKAAALARKIRETLGAQRLGLLHLNDSAGGLGEHLDRHQHVGEGKIGLAGFKPLLNHSFFRRVPMILETPRKTLEDDRRNLALVRALLGGNTILHHGGRRERREN